MTESSLPPAGWYPAPHADGQSRYWDGAAWTEHDAEQKKQSFLQRRMSRKMGLIASASALAVGILLGSSVGGSGAVAEVSSLKEQVTTLESDIGEAESVAVRTDNALEEAREDRDAALAELTATTDALEVAAAKVTELEGAATAAQGELDARAARIAELEGQVSARTAPVTAPAPAPAAPLIVSFENCTAVRNAGAAPIRSGDPGYGRHLDRDGDGIGCE